MEIRKIGTTQSLQNKIENTELDFFCSLDFTQRLSRIAGRKQGMQLFGRSFFHIRYYLPHMTFLVGAKAVLDERFWGPLALNLFEELGGHRGPSHNQLYEDFLKSIDVDAKAPIPQTECAKHFNNSWYRFIAQSDASHCLCAFAIYEILDRPDYQTLLNALNLSGAAIDSRFFKVHAKVHHFGMFESFISLLSESSDFERTWRNSTDFVLSTQHTMWKKLIAELEEGCVYVTSKQIPAGNSGSNIVSN